MTTNTTALLGIGQSGTEWERAAATAKLLNIDPPPRLKNGQIDDKIWVRVNSPRTISQIVCGHYVERGEHDYEIYRSQLPDFMRMVETASPEDRAFAQRMYEQDVESAEGERNKVDGAEYKKHYDPSYPAAFRALFKRDLLPFESVTVLDAASVSTTPAGTPEAAPASYPGRLAQSHDTPAAPKARTK